MVDYGLFFIVCFHSFSLLKFPAQVKMRKNWFLKTCLKKYTYICSNSLNKNPVLPKVIHEGQ